MNDNDMNNNNVNNDNNNINNSNNNQNLNDQMNLPPIPNRMQSSVVNSINELQPIAKAGLILNIVFAAIVCLSLLIFGFISLAVPGGSFVLIIMLVVDGGFIATLVVSGLALSKKSHNLVLAAGVLGLLFTGLIPGILILVGLNNNN